MKKNEGICGYFNKNIYLCTREKQMRMIKRKLTKIMSRQENTKMLNDAKIMTETFGNSNIFAISLSLSGSHLQ